MCINYGSCALGVADVFSRKNYMKTSVMSWERIIYSPIVFITNVFLFTSQLIGITRLSVISCVLVHGSFAFGQLNFFYKQTK